MDFTIIPVTISLVFFVIAILLGRTKNGNGSMQQIGLYIVAAALMYIGVSYLLIPTTPIQYNTSNIIITQGSATTNIGANNQTLNTGLNPQPEQVYIYEAATWFYVVLCLLFCLAGVIGRLGE